MGMIINYYENTTNLRRAIWINVRKVNCVLWMIVWLTDWLTESQKQFSSYYHSSVADNNKIQSWNWFDAKISQDLSWVFCKYTAARQSNKPIRDPCELDGNANLTIVPGNVRCDDDLMGPRCSLQQTDSKRLETKQNNTRQLRRMIFLSRDSLSNQPCRRSTTNSCY